MFRAWQGAPLELDELGRPCHAVRGFAEWLIGWLADADVAYLGCTFDSHDGRGTRRRLDPAYKADRPPIAPELFEQIERCRGVARALGLPVFTGGELEADDLIGHFAVLAQRHGHAVTIVSGDKDLAQFLRNEDAWWDAGRRDPLGVRAVTKRFGVAPEQIPDWLALAGDASDGIAGIPGVGAPTAARLLKRFADLDALFENSAAVATMRFRGAPQIARLLPDYETQVRAARRLTGRLVDDELPSDLQVLRPVLRCAARIGDDLLACGIEPDAAQRLARRAATLR